MHARLPAFEDVLQGELRKRGSWIVAELETSISWPTTQQRLTYRGRDFWLIPPSPESWPAVCTKRQNDDLRADQSDLLRFLSALSWTEDAGILVDDFSGGNLPRVMRRNRSVHGVITEYLNVPYLPEPADEDGRLALALMREGRALRHSAYAFLSLWRVLEVAIPDGKERGEWIKSTIAQLQNSRAAEAAQKLREQGIDDVSRHLREQRRHAIAHGRRSPRVDPDDASISEQLREELPIVEKLAELAIEERLGIQTAHTVWREHLYELAGFKELIGATFLTDLLAKPEAFAGKPIELPLIDVQLHRHEPFAPLKRMHPVGVFAANQRLHLRYGSEDELVLLSFALDPADERLIFEWDGGVEVRDDGAPDAALHAAEIARFLDAYLGNGELHIYDAETGQQLSRKDAFIPVNFMPNHEVFMTTVQQWKAEAARRQEELHSAAE